MGIFFTQSDDIFWAQMEKNKKFEILIEKNFPNPEVAELTQPEQQKKLPDLTQM